MRNWVILAVALLFFGFSLFQASWLAPLPAGKPLLLAAKGAEPTRDRDGCATGPSGTDVGALAMAVGNEADALHVELENDGSQLVITRQYDSNCASDKARGRAGLAEATYALSKPHLFFRAKGAGQAEMLLGALPADPDGAKFSLIGDEAAVAAFRESRPKSAAFTVAEARACASDYKVSGLWGAMPESCAQGTMLLTVDETGYTLWGWPNRFLARTAEAGVKVMIAESIDGETIKGLTDVNRYGDIANSFNGHIWIEDIAELGPALKR